MLSVLNLNYRYFQLISSNLLGSQFMRHMLNDLK